MKPCKLFTGRLNNKQGYPWGLREGKPVRLHAWTCEQVHGPKPGPEYEASHLCNNKRCLEESHLLWETKSQNNMRKDYETRQRAARAGGIAAKAVDKIRGRGWSFNASWQKPYRVFARGKHIGYYATQGEAEAAYRAHR